MIDFSTIKYPKQTKYEYCLFNSILNFPFRNWYVWTKFHIITIDYLGYLGFMIHPAWKFQWHSFPIMVGILWISPFAKIFFLFFVCEEIKLIHVFYFKLNKTFYSIWRARLRKLCVHFLQIECKEWRFQQLGLEIWNIQLDKLLMLW